MYDNQRWNVTNLSVLEDSTWGYFMFLLHSIYLTQNTQIIRKKKLRISPDNHPGQSSVKPQQRRDQIIYGRSGVSLINYWHGHMMSNQSCSK